MPTTPTYGIPYPALTDPPNGATQMRDLALEVESELARVDSGALSGGSIAPVFSNWTPYTPTWTSTGTAPAIGNGVRIGGHLHIGKLCAARFYFEIGSTSGLGTGTYRMGLPFTAASPVGLSAAVWPGSALVRDLGGSPARYEAVAPVDAGATDVVLVAGGVILGATTPFTLAAGDYFTALVIYETV